MRCGVTLQPKNRRQPGLVGKGRKNSGKGDDSPSVAAIQTERQCPVDADHRVFEDRHCPPSAGARNGCRNFIPRLPGSYHPNSYRFLFAFDEVSCKYIRISAASLPWANVISRLIGRNPP